MPYNVNLYNMAKITDIIDFNGMGTSEIIANLKNKSVPVPNWGELVNEYEPSLHEVTKDHVNLKDKKNGTEKSARISLGLEKLLSSRMSEFTFSIPVKRIYHYPDDNGVYKDIQAAIEKIYENNHIGTVNLKRGLAYYAACEVFTIWYTVKKENALYGFPCNYKLKCKTYSPMDGVKLYPLIDELDDMQAMSFEYRKKVGDKVITYFETYTENRHYVWRQGMDGNNWEELTAQVGDNDETTNGEEIVIGKIPGAYVWRLQPVYHGLSTLRNEIEYTLSRNSNVIAYNAAPVLKISGGIQGMEDKGESRRIYRVENGGDVSYVSWSQAIEAIKYHVDTMLKLYWMQSQMPDISFENMKGLGNIGYDARQTLLTDAHLKIGYEAGAWQEFFEREFNVIKAFLAQINGKWKPYLDNVTCEHIITPFIQNDELADINKRMKANGGKPIESQLESIIKFGQSTDPNETLEQIQKETKAENTARATAFSMQNQEI